LPTHDTAANDVHSATWSTGTMLIVLLIFGTTPNWIHPFTIRHMKSSVFVTTPESHPENNKVKKRLTGRPRVTDNIARSHDISSQSPLPRFKQ